MNRRDALRLLGSVLLAPAGYKILFAAPDEARLLEPRPIYDRMKLDDITGGERGKYGYASLEDFNAWQLEVNNLMRAALDRQTPLMRLFKP